MKSKKKDVHTEHCCAVHGCKYGDNDCTVITREKRQSFLCEWCSDVIRGYESLKNEYYRVLEVKTLLNATEESD